MNGKRCAHPEGALYFHLEQDGKVPDLRGDLVLLTVVGLATEAQYWCREAFLPTPPCSPESIGELHSISVHDIALLVGSPIATDAIPSDNSLVPCSVADLQQLGLVTDVAVDRIDKQDGYAVSQDDLCEYPQGSSLSISMGRLLDPILFGAHLHGIWVDHTITLLRWRSFVGALYNERSGFTIYPTVLLAVDVSFLVIPEMNGNATVQTATEFVIFLFLSTASAVGILYTSHGQDIRWLGCTWDDV
ncbi:hypothetical protein BS17DRAFT_769203 [Gyrodon lividus]|nr:hypothetical protein BS17DRAFT_769203 [Gyrodon lividus]